MFSTRNLVTLIAAALVFTAWRSAVKRSERERQWQADRREALQTWEGEGGALPEGQAAPGPERAVGPF